METSLEAGSAFQMLGAMNLCMHWINTCKNNDIEYTFLLPQIPFSLFQFDEMEKNEKLKQNLSLNQNICINFTTVINFLTKNILCTADFVLQ